MEEKTVHKMAHREKRTWSVGSLFWGLLFVLLGGLLLADNLNWLEVHWENVWMLWPIIIIAIGLSIMSIKNIAWKIITLVLAVTAVVLVGYAVLGDNVAPVKVDNYTVAQAVDNKDIARADVIIKAGASKINIDAKDQAEIVNANLESNNSKLDEQSSVSGSTQTVELTMATLNRWWFGSNAKNNLDISLGTKLPTDFSMDFGAADAYIDLSQAKVENITIKTGASSTTLKIGDKVDQVAADIESGVSSIVIRVPSGSGVKLNISNGLTSKHLADLEDRGGDMYESPNYDTATKKIDITAKIGVASFTVERY